MLSAVKTGTNATFVYDPLGRRVKKQINTARNWYLSDGTDEIAEYTGITAATLAFRYIPGPAIDQPVAMVTAAGAKTYFHTDKRGSVIAMTDSSGNLVTGEGPNTYDPFGNVSSSTGVPFKYTGRRLDAETGLYYYRARYYSSALGRFLQTDGVGYSAGMNLYAYVGNDPTDKTDPMGTDAVLITDQNTGVTTLVIPVQFSGQDASAANVGTIVNRANSISISNPNMKIQVISTSAPVHGVLNKMDFSAGYNNKMCGSAGECVNNLGGDKAHINSANGQSTDAAVHDIFHFAGIDDQYQEGPRDAQGNRTSTPKPGYNNTNIMTSRSGTQLKPQQFQESQSNSSTKKCVVQIGSRIPTCN